MDALRLGSFVISAPRLYAGLALALLVVGAELTAWRARRRGAAADAGWAWNAALAVVVGARLGFVLENLGYYRNEPLGTLAFWQVGFSPWWGVAAGALVALVSLRRRGQRASRLVLPAALALGAWLLVPALLTPAGGRSVAFPTGAHERLAGGEFAFAVADGRPTVVNLWATWCAPCRRELPQLARAAREHPGVRLLYVNQGEGRAAVADFLAAYPDVERASVLLDPRQRVGNALGSVGLPATYFFDAAGNHVKTHVGEISGAALARELRALARAE